MWVHILFNMAIKFGGTWGKSSGKYKPYSQLSRDHSAYVHSQWMAAFHRAQMHNDPMLSIIYIMFLM